MIPGASRVTAGGYPVSNVVVKTTNHRIAFVDR
jgi:hypothetical protein